MEMLYVKQVYRKEFKSVSEEVQVMDSGGLLLVHLLMLTRGFPCGAKMYFIIESMTWYTGMMQSILPVFGFSVA